MKKLPNTPYIPKNYNATRSMTDRELKDITIKLACQSRELEIDPEHFLDGKVNISKAIISATPVSVKCDLAFTDTEHELIKLYVYWILVRDEI